ncbi:hypothetical protein [Novispirillum itersonii]|uniref:hypothetical protein n=1 Tax=Novispirillum itersonii TaxID=189 RepID=UPI0003632E59|nr:hypothetical protein [Novispirillum itersonii]
MTAFNTAAGGDRLRLPTSVHSPGGRAFRRSPRVGPPPLPAVPPCRADRSGGAVAGDPEQGARARAGRPASSAVPPPPPPVRRDPVRNTIDWSQDLVDWLYACRIDGIPVAVLARTIGCSTQTVFTQFHRDPRGVPEPASRTRQRVSPRDFVRWGRGLAEDMPAEVLEREVRRVRPGTAPVGPLTRLTPRPRIGRALDFSDDT